MSVPVLLFNQILSCEPIGPNHQPNPPPKSLCADSVKCSLSFCAVNILLKWRSDKNKTPKAQITQKKVVRSSSLMFSVVRRQKLNTEKLYSQNRGDAFSPLADRKLEVWSRCRNALKLPPPHGGQHQVRFVSMAAMSVISASAMLCRAYVLQ